MIRYRLVLFLIVLMVYTARVGGDQTDGVFNLTSHGPSYTATYTFTTSCPAESLLNAFLLPEHVVACMKRANLRIEVVDSGYLRNRIVYTYSYVISQLRLRFDRRADTLGHRMIFTMESCTTSGSSVVPTIRSSHGSYTITKLESGCRVEYRQQTSLDRNLTDFHLFFIRRDTHRVLRNQERYVANWKSP